MRDFSDVRQRIVNAEMELESAKSEPGHSTTEDNLIDSVEQLTMALRLIVSDLEVR